MNSPLEKYQKQLGSIASSIINLFPYLTYILLMKQEENIVIAALPLVIFYAFRRTALFIFSSLRHDYNKIGWIGLTCACWDRSTYVFMIYQQYWRASEPQLFQLLGSN